MLRAIMPDICGNSSFIKIYERIKDEKVFKTNYRT